VPLKVTHEFEISEDLYIKLQFNVSLRTILVNAVPGADILIAFICKGETPLNVVVVPVEGEISKV
jgi:hypothetical protein